MYYVYEQLFKLHFTNQLINKDSLNQCSVQLKVQYSHKALIELDEWPD